MTAEQRRIYLRDVRQQMILVIERERVRSNSSKRDSSVINGFSRLSESQPDLVYYSLRAAFWVKRRMRNSNTSNSSAIPRPPLNAEYLLYFFLRKEEREAVIGDLLEEYSQILGRFNKRRADIWFYKQVGGSLLPLFRRTLLRIGALVWLGRILRRLVS